MEQTPRDKIIWELEYSLLSLEAEYDYLRRKLAEYRAALINTNDREQIKTLNELVPQLTVKMQKTEQQIEEFRERLMFVRDHKGEIK